MNFQSLSPYVLHMHARKVSVKLLLKSLRTIDIPHSTYKGIQRTRMVSMEQGWNLRFCMCVGGTKYWFQSVTSFITIEHKKDIKSSIGSLEEQFFFFCWTFIHGYSTYATTSMTCHIEFQLTTIIHQKTNTPGQPHKNTHLNKNTTQQRCWNELSQPWREHQQKGPHLRRPHHQSATRGHDMRRYHIRLYVGMVWYYGVVE